MNDPLLELRERLASRHHAIGWCALLLFLTLGIVLETLLGLKTAYLDRSHETQRMLWRLAHAHGTLIALVHIAFAVGLPSFGTWSIRGVRLASFFLIDALLFLPLGFFLGGVGYTEVDPGPGVVLAPIGAGFFFIAVAMIAVAAVRKP